MGEIVRCMDCGYCDIDSWGAWCNKENAKLNDVCDEHECDSFFSRIEKDASYQQLSKALCGKENATLDEMLNAVKQLKRRSEPEMRPLTLAEVKSHCAKRSDAEPLYIEFSRRTTLSRWILVAPNIECNEPATVTRYLDIWEQDYSKTWRCWPRKPTPEQMAAEKWEE